MDKDIYAKSTRQQLRNKRVDLVCMNCGEDDPRIIELHHIEGRTNSDELTPLCKNCHAKVSIEQNKFPPKARSKNASPDKRRAYRLVTIGALLVEFGKTLINIGHEAIHHG